MTVTPKVPNGCALSAGSVVVDIGAPPADPTCVTSDETESADHCKTTRAQTCGDGAGKSSSSNWAVTWDADGNGGTGIMTYAFSLNVDATPCVSTVGVTYARQ